MNPKYFFALHDQKFCFLRKEQGQIFIEQVGSFGENVKPLDTLQKVCRETSTKLLSRPKPPPFFWNFPLLLQQFASKWLQRSKKQWENSFFLANLQQTQIVTGLSSSEVILRNLTLKLKSKREILAALPFQVENFLPYPTEELILLPASDTQKEHTLVSLLATSQKTVQHHLENSPVDPDIVSCLPLALFRYARHFFPEEKSLFLYHGGTFIVMEEGKLQACQAIKEEDLPRVTALMQKKYPSVTAKVVQEGKEWEFALAIGLALDAASSDGRAGQFRMRKNLSLNHRKKRRKLWVHFFSLCGSFVLLTSFLSHFHVRKREKTILEVLECKKNISLSKAILELEENLHKPKKETLSVSTLPKVSELLVWLSTHPKLTEDSSITRFRYQLLKTPRLGTQVKTQSAKVDIELTTQNPNVAKSFYEALLKNTLFVDQKNDIRWNADHGIYRASFYVKPKK